MLADGLVCVSGAEGSMFLVFGITLEQEVQLKGEAGLPGEHRGRQLGA